MCMKYCYPNRHQNLPLCAWSMQWWEINNFLELLIWWVENLTMLRGLSSHGSENLSTWNAILPTSQATITLMVLSSFNNGKPRCREKQRCALGKPSAEHRITPTGWGLSCSHIQQQSLDHPSHSFPPLSSCPCSLKYNYVFSHEILIHTLVKIQIHYISLFAFIH